jgi:hypothetical protein
MIAGGELYLLADFSVPTESACPAVISSELPTNRQTFPGAASPEHRSILAHTELAPEHSLRLK